MRTQRESPSTAVGTEAITSSAHNFNGVRLDEQSDIIHDSFFGSVPAQMSEDPALDVLIPEESPGDLEKSELLRQATEAAFAHIRRLRERGSNISPTQIEKLVLSMVNTSIAQHNKETKDRLPRYQELPPAVLAEVFAFEHPVVLVGTGTPTSPAHLSLAVYESEGGLAGTYRILDQAQLHALLRPYCFSVTVRQAAETYAHLRAIAPVIDETMKPNLVPVENGVFNTETQQLEPFSPERVFLTKSPVPYDPSAVSPVKRLKDGTQWEFDQWLADLFSDDKDRVSLFWEIAAASLRVYKRYEKAFLFFSESGSSGKSTLLHLLRNLLGEENCASLSLAEFGEHFGCEPLLGASAVLCDETDTYSFMKECRTFKQYVTHDVIKVDRKGIPSVRWKPRGLVIQAANKLPEFSDKTEAMARRFIFVSFDRTFASSFDPSIKTEFMVDSQVQRYVLRRALELPEFTTFTQGQLTFELGERAKLANNPVLEWWEDEAGEFQTNLIPWDFAFAVFCAWYKKRFPMGKPISRREFVRRMGEIAQGSDEWYAMDAKDTALVIAQYWVTNQESLAVYYNLSDWMLPAVLSQGNLPSELQHKPRVRGLLRVGTASAPAQPVHAGPPVQRQTFQLAQPAPVAPQEEAVDYSSLPPWKWPSSALSGN
ncbi:DNA primase family protein [Trueperella pyogenes]|uniref:DNA primase family protein n=1 Tax=Trueperella pyogenes TaxID=1661 RepID=UPI00345DF9F6